MKWSILIPTTDVRVSQFKGLLTRLLFQTQLYTDIEIVAYFNRRTTPLGDIRQALVEDAKGQYISFVDDDDSVHDNYCTSIYPHLDGINDCVGFRTQITINGRTTKPVFNSIRLKGWWQDGAAYYRDVNYLCPIKREKYDGVSFISQNCYEDMDWANKMRGKLKYEKYLNEILYYYNCNFVTSLTQNANPVVADPQPRLDISHPRFRYHPRSEL